MCNIAGYTGDRQAAPILIEMLRREEYIDGGICTGIATIHEGKMYMAKVVGNVDELLRQTDALHFPGTVGIAHSRPGGNLASQAHPFADKNENLALVLNGTLRDVGTPEFYQHSAEIMQGFLDRGFPIRTAIPKNGAHHVLTNGMSYHDTEPYALYIGDKVDNGMDIAHAAAAALAELPADIVLMCIHAALDGVITAGRITRPVTAGICQGETFLATTALAFPEDRQYRNIVPVPVASVAQARPGSLTITDAVIEGVRVQEIDHALASVAYARMEALLQGQKDDPKCMYDMPFFEEWRDIWDEPLVDCAYKTEKGLLKPYAALMYEILWDFHKQGRLHSVHGDIKGKPITRFWID